MPNLLRCPIGYRNVKILYPCCVNSRQFRVLFDVTDVTEG